MEFGIYFSRYWPVFCFVLSLTTLFGVAYNGLINWMHRNGYTEGYTWLTVVIGDMAVLLAAAALFWLTGIGLLPILLTLALFAAGGVPMALGDMARFFRARKSLEKPKR